MATLTDWLASPDIHEYVRVREGLWVRLVNQSDGSQYISTGATDEDGAWTIDPRPPAGTYIMSIASSAIGPWIPTGYTYEVSGEQSGVVHTTGDQTINGNKTALGHWYFGSGRPWIDVISKGADPTCTTDSTAAIQAALDAIDASGGTVFLNGNFRVDGSLHPKQGTVIEGPGMPVGFNDIGGDSHGTLRPARLSGNFGPGNGTLIVGDPGVNAVTIRGIEMVGSGGVYSTNIGISIDGWNWVVENCFLRNFGGPAIQTLSGSDACRFNHIVAQGMLVRPSVRTGTFDIQGADHFFNQCEINCSITAADGTGNAIGLMIRSGNCFVTDSVIEFAHVGVVILGGTDGGIGLCHFKGTRSEFNNQQGWQIEGGGCEFIGCVSYNNGTLANNTYDGWNVIGFPDNRFIGCIDTWFSGPNGTRYSFTDSQQFANTNHYIGCVQLGGGQSGLFNFTQPQGSIVKVAADVTANRPSASASGAGAMWYDTTLGKPIWSDGSVWKDAAGTPV